VAVKFLKPKRKFNPKEESQGGRKLKLKWGKSTRYYRKRMRGEERIRGELFTWDQKQGHGIAFWRAELWKGGSRAMCEIVREEKKKEKCGGTLSMALKMGTRSRRKKGPF